MILAAACLANRTTAAALAAEANTLAADATVPPPLQRCEFVEPHMGTLFQLVVYAPEPARARPAAQTAFARIAALNRILSDYDARSEAMRLCGEPAGQPVKVSPDLLAVLQRSQQLAELSAGAFDVTLGPLTFLWREARRGGRLPEPGALAAARAGTGYTHLGIEAAAGTVTLARPGMRLDFGGIAKGYAADEALAVLRRFGFASALVAASGDFALGDPPPGTRGWRIALEPFGGSSPEPLVVVAANAGLSTSADTEQHVEIGGVRYSHILDPRTGLGLTRPAGVTVMAASATLADSLATACSVLPEDDLAPLLARLGAPARVLVHPRERGSRATPRSHGTDPAGLVAVGGSSLPSAEASAGRANGGRETGLATDGTRGGLRRAE